jgi:tRNA threonylcarbamoyladenosine modification (KEOPS) complex Cgi121 subunit
MDFITASFPDQKLNISLFKVGESKSIQSLTDLQFQYKDNICIVNAKLVASLFHLNIGVSRAIINIRDQTNTGQKKMETKNFGQEVLFHLSTSTSIDACFDHYGTKGIYSGFFLVMLNMSPEQEQVVKTQLKQQYQEVNITEHLQFADMQGIISHFKVEDQEL